MKINALNMDKAIIINVVAFVMTTYHFTTAWFGVPIGFFHRPLHVLFAFTVLFLVKPFRQDDNHSGIHVVDLFLIVMTVLSTGFLIVNAEEYLQRIVRVYDLTTQELFFGIVLIIVILEASRRTVGWPLPVIVITFLLYAFFGNFLPPPFWHREYTLSQIVEHLYLTLEGVWGVPVYTTSTYVFLFILFGAFLFVSGTGEFFSDFARALTGRSIGGPAKTAVVASALMGMISGSSVANVVTTGAFTIPTMKKEGYLPHTAAAIEAVASSGGQIAPPIMGAAAFIMAEFTGIPYIQIMKHALIPAFLYFFSVFLMGHLEACRIGLKPHGKQTLHIWTVLKKRGYLFLPVVAAVWFLILGYTPLRAAFWAIITLLILIVLFDPINRKKMCYIIIQSFERAPTLVVSVTSACAAAGIVVGVLTMTGLGLRLTSIVLAVSGGRLLIVLFLSMVMAIVLGMGMPTSGAYIIMACLLAPGIIKLGVPIIVAHMFVQYFACVSAITPPVAIASYAAAGIAKADPWKTGLTAFRLGIVAFIIPYMFVYKPSLLFIGDIDGVALSVVTAIIGVIALATSIVGWIKIKVTIAERIVLLLAAFTLICSGITTDLIGSILLTLVFILHWRRFNIIEKRQDIYQKSQSP